MSIVSCEWNDLQCYFEAAAPEEMTSEYPGCPEVFDLTEAWVGKVDIARWLSEDVVRQIETDCRQQVRERKFDVF